MDKTDAHGFAVAVRETSEEVGLQLGAADPCIGRLSEVNARLRRGSFGMAVTPFVFHLRREVTFSPNHEVAEIVWVPLAYLLDPHNREQMTWEYQGTEFPMPCYIYQERRIWGLSLMMLDELLSLIEGASVKRGGWRRRKISRGRAR
jgi:8-oxo-dGTP pyrophosphatase MutT (NUDIX family)